MTISVSGNPVQLVGLFFHVKVLPCMEYGTWVALETLELVRDSVTRIR